MSRAAWLTAAALLALALPGPAPQPGPCPDPSGAAGLLCGRLLDLNAASPEALEALPGVGPARARALVEARPFASLAEVERVPGIGPVTSVRFIAALDNTAAQAPFTTVRVRSAGQVTSSHGPLCGAHRPGSRPFSK